MRRVDEKEHEESLKVTKAKVFKLKGLAIPSCSFPTLSLRVGQPAGAKICDKSCGNSISFSAFFNVYCQPTTLSSEVFEFFES